MEKNKNAMTGLLAVGLCLGLLWGVSPSMAASSFQLYKTDKAPSVYHPSHVQPLQGQPQKPPKPGAGSLLVKPFNTKNSNLNPAYGKNSANTSKFNHTDAGRGSANINIGQPVTLDPKGTQQNVPKAIQAEQAYEAKMKAQHMVTNAVDNPSIFHRDAGKPIDIGKPFGTFNPTQQNHSKAWQAMQAAKAKEAQQAMINKIGTPFGTHPKWNHGDHGGGNGVLPPPTQVPVSTAPTPPPAQSSTQHNQAGPEPNSGPLACNPAVDLCVH